MYIGHLLIQITLIQKKIKILNVILEYLLSGNV